MIENQQVPSFDDFVEFAGRFLAGTGMALTTGSPIEVVTSDGAVLSLIVVKHPSDDQRRWRVSVEGSNGSPAHL